MCVTHSRLSSRGRINYRVKMQFFHCQCGIINMCEVPARVIILNFPCFFFFYRSKVINSPLAGTQDSARCAVLCELTESTCLSHEKWVFYAYGKESYHVGPTLRAAERRRKSSTGANFIYLSQNNIIFCAHTKKCFHCIRANGWENPNKRMKTFFFRWKISKVDFVGDGESEFVLLWFTAAVWRRIRFSVEDEPKVDEWGEKN